MRLVLVKGLIMVFALCCLNVQAVQGEPVSDRLPLKGSFESDNKMVNETYRKACEELYRLYGTVQSDSIYGPAELQTTSSHPFIIAAYGYKQLCQLAESARQAGNEASAKEYESMAIKAKADFNRRFWNAEKQQYDDNSVTANLLPLAFGLADEVQKAIAEKHLIKQTVHYYDADIRCGAIGLRWLLCTLSEIGRNDVAYKLITNGKYPITPVGDLVPFVYQHLAGIRASQPDYKELAMKPAFDLESVGYIRASLDTPNGKVKSHWSQTPTDYTWEIALPIGTSATVWLPAPYEKNITEKGRKLKKAEGVEVLRQEGGYTLCRIKEGSYSFHILKQIDYGHHRQGITADYFVCNYPPFPESHAATIVETREGVVAAWFGGTKEKNPDCCIWTSRLTKEGWTEPLKAADGVLDGTKYACWNPVLTVTPSGELQLYYKIGVNVAGWTGHVVRSSDNGRSWGKSEALPEGILGPIKNKPVYVDGKMICPSSKEDGGDWRVYFEISDDEGRTWRSVGPVRGKDSAMPSIQPTIIVHPDGRLQALCRTRNLGYISTCWSYDKGETWTPLELMKNLPNNNSGIDAVTLKDGRFLLVYNHMSRFEGGERRRTPIQLAISNDGINWQAAAVLEDSPINQYSYPSMIQAKDGTVHIVYTWRRQRVKYATVDPAQLHIIPFEETDWK